MWTAQACGAASAGGIGALPGAALVAAKEKLRVVPDRDGLPQRLEPAVWEGGGGSTVARGSAGGGLHAADEWVDLAQVHAYARPRAGLDVVLRQRQSIGVRRSTGRTRSVFVVYPWNRGDSAITAAQARSRGSPSSWSTATRCVLPDTSART
jgi:hypothetical protein